MLESYNYTNSLGITPQRHHRSNASLQRCPILRYVPVQSKFAEEIMIILAKYIEERISPTNILLVNHKKYFRKGFEKTAFHLINLDFLRNIQPLIKYFESLIVGHLQNKTRQRIL